MKKVFSTLLVFCIAGFSFLSAQDQDNNENGDKPTIEFEKKVHNYGTIDYNGDGNCIFVFENKGDVPLTLKNVRSSCGCTTPKWPREPIAPGKTNEIKVKYNTRIVGNFTKSIVVYSNAANSPVRLTIKGKVVKKQANRDN